MNASIQEFTELDAAHDTIEDLQAELVVARMTSLDTNEQKQAAALIGELREEIRKLSVNLKAVKQSRDTFQNEVGMLKQQIHRQRKEIDKATGGRTA